MDLKRESQPGRYAIVGLFVATWAISAAIWKFGRIEERWSAVPERIVHDAHDA